MKDAHGIKKGEVQFEAKSAREQRKERLQFNPIRSYHIDPFFRWRINTICNQLAPTEGDRILDMGSASCEVAEYFTYQGCNVTGIDISPDMLKLGKERIFDLPAISQLKTYENEINGSKTKQQRRKRDYNPRQNINFVVGDCDRLPFRSGTFDKIICWATLHHMPNPESTLYQMARVLKKEGTCLLFEPNALNMFRRLQEATWTSPNLETSFYPWDLQNLIKRVGLEIKNYTYVRPSVSIAKEERNAIQRAVKVVYSKISRRKPYKFLFGEIAALCVRK